MSEGARNEAAGEEYRAVARLLLDDLLREALAGGDADATAAAHVLAEGTAFAAALAEEVSIAKNRWWEQTRQPAGSPPGGEFADMGRGRSAGGGGVRVSNTPMADRIVPASFVVPAAAANGANGAARSEPASHLPASPERRKGPWSDKSYPEMREFIAEKEQSAKKPNDGYGEFNHDSRELGRYQLKPSSLLQIGWLAKTPQGELYWTDKAKAQEVTSWDDFLRNPAAQEAAMTDYLLDNDRQLRANGAKKFIGMEVVGIVGTFKISEGGLAAAAHRGGPGDIRDYLQFRRDNPPGAPIPPKERRRFLPIETRLREAERL